MCRVLSLVAIVAVAFSAGCGKSATAKFDTPEAAFAAFQEATEAEDWPTAANCMTADSQTMMADTLILGASLSTGGDAQKENDVKALLKKHGIDLDAEPPAAKQGAEMPAISASVNDKPALINDLMVWLKRNKDSGSVFVQVKKIGKVTINGDKASAMVGTNDGQSPMAFVRVDGGWLISMAEGRGPGGPPNLDPGDIPDASLEPEGAVGPGAEPGAGRGTLWMNEKPHELRYAIAYKTAHFDEPCTAILMTARPLRQNSLNLLKKVLEEDGHDLGFFAPGVSLRLLFGADGKPQYLFAWADNVSINANSGVEAQMSERDGRVVGNASRKSDETDSEKMKYRFDVEFDAALLPFAVKPIEKSETNGKEVERVHAGQSEADRAERAADTPSASRTEEAVKETDKVAPPPTEPSKPAEPAVTIDETPREPATVEQAVRLLDLRTFPLIDGARILSGRRQVGNLSYERTGDMAEVFEFQRKHLKTRGWKELPGADESLARNNPRATYTQDGFLVSMSVGMYVSIRNHGNVLVGKLPVPAGAEPFYGDITRASYVTRAPASETMQACRKSLLDLGWKPYGHAGDTMYFKQNAVKLSARVSVHDAQPGKTFIDYSTELLSADIPVPADVADPRYTDAMKTLHFDHPGNAVASLAAFYGDELKRQGFTATGEPVGQEEVAVVYRNDKQEMITLDMRLYQDLTRVDVRHYSGAEVAEMDRQLKAEAAKREAERKLQAEAAERDAEVAREAQRRLTAEAEKREAERVKRLAMKVAIPIPGKAKKVEQRNSENIEITVALGAGKTIVQALGKHFQAAGWQQVEAELDDDEDGSLRVSKGDASLTFEYRDWFGSDEIDVDADNIKLEPSRDIAEFAALGGVVRGAAPPAELLAKAPADIPIPADARDVQVRSGANIAYELAGDLNTLAAYFRTAMARRGWTYDAASSRVDAKNASLSFKKGRSPAGVSLSNFWGGDYVSVTIAGGGMNWSRLRGARAVADPTVAAELAALKSNASGAKTGQPSVPATRQNKTAPKTQPKTPPNYRTR
jgi:hypothetical protein